MLNSFMNVIFIILKIHELINFLTYAISLLLEVLAAWQLLFCSVPPPYVSNVIRLVVEILFLLAQA